MLSQELIDEIVRRVLTVGQPDKIILFGSAARGDLDPDSDVDLLVLRETIADRYSEAGAIYQAMYSYRYPCDIVLMSTDWFARFKNVAGTVAYPANKEGRLIYGR